MKYADLLTRLAGYNPPDRTIDEQRQIATDIHEAKDAIEDLSAACADALGLLDDPTGGEHVSDMRNASERLRDALGLQKMKGTE